MRRISHIHGVRIFKNNLILFRLNFSQRRNVFHRIGKPFPAGNYSATCFPSPRVDFQSTVGVGKIWGRPLLISNSRSSFVHWLYYGVNGIHITRCELSLSLYSLNFIIQNAPLQPAIGCYRQQRRGSFCSRCTDGDSAGEIKIHRYTHCVLLYYATFFDQLVKHQ